MAEQSMTMMILTAVYALCWGISSSAIIIINKKIMMPAVGCDHELRNNDGGEHVCGLGFAYPMTLTLMGMVFSACASAVALSAKKMYYRYFCRSRKQAHVENTKYSKSHESLGWCLYITAIVPASAFSAMTLVSGNSAYQYLSVSFIQMLKAFTPVVTMIVSIAIIDRGRISDTNKKVILPTLIITFGTLVSSYSEPSFNQAGVAIFAVSMVSEACRVVLVQKAIGGGRLGAMESLWYTSPACAVCLLCSLCVYELDDLLAAGGLAIIDENKLTFLLASSLGFVVNAFSMLLLAASSGLSLKIIGAIKNVLVVILGVILFGDRVTVIQSIGYTVSLIGFGLYNKMKMQGTAKIRQTTSDVQKKKQ